MTRTLLISCDVTVREATAVDVPEDVTDEDAFVRETLAAVREDPLAYEWTRVGNDQDQRTNHETSIEEH